MKKAKEKILALIVTSMFVVTGNSFVVFADENGAVNNSLKEALLQNLKSNINEGDKFSNCKYLEKDTENSGLDESSNPEETVRVIVELDKKPATLELEDGKQPSQEEVQKVKDEQKPILEKVKEETGGEVRHTYGNLINGFSMEVKRKEIKKIKSVDGVDKVKEVNLYYHDMTSAKELTQALNVWKDYRYKGEGLVVSIIDSGIDYRHKDMNITDPSKAKLNKDNLKDGKGKYYTEKVPYGYNFADDNDEVIDYSGSMHGMHVAGIVGANAKEDEVKENKGIQGVAPEAQLLDMKVFTNNKEVETAYSDDIIAAIEESVEQKADVINMSLGSPAQYREGENPEQVAIKNATDDGVICVVSAGNSGTSISPNIIEGFSDISTVGAPGLASDALQVASYENSKVVMKAFKTTLGGTDTFMGYNECDVNPIDVFKKDEELELVNCEKGNTSDFEGKDLKGKVALVSRGDISFADKQINAQKAGAVAVVIYNNKDDGYISMSSDKSVKIPSLFILKDDGIKLKEAIDKGVKISFGDYMKSAQNMESNMMSDFSSWGPAPNLEFAPQITGPGGNIYSTLNDNTYGTKSGTSMSSPHVAGATALIIQGLKNKGINLKGRELVEFVKKSIINTAEPLIETNSLGEKVPFSPRRQGAGMIQTKTAINNRVLAVGEDGQATISLKEIGDKTEFKIKLKNYSDKEEKYKVEALGDVLTAFTPSMSGENIINDKMAFDTVLKDASIDFDTKEVVVPANGEVTINSVLKVKSGSVKDNFVEGFINFVPENEDTPKLVVPYMGFYGEWDNQKIIDASAWENKDVLLTPSYAASKVLGKYNYLGYEKRDSKNNVVVNPDKIAISPNGDGNGDEFAPVLYLLRNAKNIQVDLLDKDKKIIATNINGDNDFVRKIVKSKEGTKAKVCDSITWDGTAYNKSTGKNEKVADGQYYLNYKANVDGEGAKSQDYIMPVKVDTEGTTVNLVSKPDSEKTTYKLEANFNGEYEKGLVNDLAIAVNGQKVEKFNVDGDILTADLELKDNSVNDIEIATLDNAFNTKVNKFQVTVGNVKSEVKLVNFKEGAMVIDNNFVVNGTYSGPVDKLLINGEAPDNMGDGKFSKTLTLKEGLNTILLYAKDSRGKVIINQGYRVICDTENPVLNITEPIVGKDGVIVTPNNVVKVKGSVSDNVNGYKLFVNGENKLNISLDGAKGAKETKREFDYDIQVSDGDIITLRAVDFAEHETIKQIKVKIDKTIPEINVLGIENGKVYKNNVQPKVNVTPELAKLDMTLNGVEYKGEEITEEGNYELQIKVTNNNGLSKNVKLDFSIDKTSPMVTVNNIEDGKSYNQDLMPKVETEKDAVISMKLNGKDYNGEMITEEGKYQLVVTSIDKAGNTTEKSVNFVLDKTLPVVSIDDIIDGMTYNKEVKPIVKGDKDATINITLNDKPYNGEVIKEKGQYVIKVEAKDEAGNITEISRKFIIDLKEKSIENPTPAPQPMASSSINSDKEKVTDDISSTKNEKEINGEKKIEKNKMTKNILPKTGETKVIYFVVTAVALILVGAILLLKKRKKTIKEDKR